MWITHGGGVHFIWHRFKPIMWTTFVCLIFAILNDFIFFDNILEDSIFDYLWFIPYLMLVLGFYYFLRCWIKDLSKFNIAVAILGITFLVIETFFVNFGLFRGIAMVGIGILISQLPSIKKYKWCNIVSAIIVFLLIIEVVLLEVVPVPKLLQNVICIFIVFPSLVYFALQIAFSNKYINAICSINFGIYTYQEVARFLYGYFGVENMLILFVVVLTCAILDRLVVNYIKNRKKQKTLV